MDRIIIIVVSEMCINMEQEVWVSWVKEDTEMLLFSYSYSYYNWLKIRGIEGTYEEWCDKLKFSITTTESKGMYIQSGANKSLILDGEFLVWKRHMLGNGFGLSQVRVGLCLGKDTTQKFRTRRKNGPTKSKKREDKRWM